MIDDMWPDLSGWCPLPEGGTIPEGARYAVLESDGFVTVSTAKCNHTPDESSYRYRTERPVPVPLPTEEGARIIACGPWGGLAELTLTRGEWETEPGYTVPTRNITRWAPAPDWRSTH